MPFKTSWVKSLLLAIPFCFIPVVTKAQISADGTVPTDVSTPDNQNFTIEGGEQAGANLFHSFNQFSVPNGGSANFNNAPDINNIINRVTGGSVSNIDGLIKASGAANLFLINPAGVVFGAGAKLDIGGSFLASSADSLLFSDGNVFSALDPQSKPLLTVNAPIGLQLRENSVPIQVQAANLAVKPNQNLTLVGGNLNLDGGKLTAPGGQIQLGGIASAGRVGITENGNLSFPNGVGLADLSLTNGASADVRSGGGGAIAVNARNLELSKGSFLAAGIGSGLGNVNAQAGDININATDGISLNNSFIDNGINEKGTGTAGEVKLTTSNLSLTDSSRIGNNLFGNGQSGNITINASGEISLTGGSTLQNKVIKNAVGNAGNIDISAKSLNLQDRSQILADTAGKGSAGNINIKANDAVSLRAQSGIFNQVLEGAIGNGGTLAINAANLSLGDNSLLVSNTYGQGDAGKIAINTSGKVSFDNSFIQTKVIENAVGKGGNIEIVADSLDLTNKSQFLADTDGVGDAGNVDLTTNQATSLSGSSLIISKVNKTGRGNAGGININAGSFSLAAGATPLADFSQLISNTEGKGNGGDITIKATNSILLDRGRLLSASGEPDVNPVGNAGDITLIAPQIDFKNFSFVSAAAPKRVTGEAGNININADNLRIREGTIVNTLTETGFKGGDINVNAKTLEMNTGGKIVTATVQQGNAGNINLNVTDNIILDGNNPFKRPAEVRVFEEPFLNDLEPSTGLFANTNDTATGNGGSITIGNPKSMTISNGAKVSVASQGQGNSGKLTIQTGKLTLRNGGAIEASTASGEGGNASLQVKDILMMRDNSLISAQAKGNANGGNIDIDSGFVVAFEGGNNDIIASAERGNGGNIRVTTESMFGLQQRRNTPFSNDVDASSDYSLAGNVVINTPDVDPAQGAIAPPESVVEPETIAAQACSADNTAQKRSSFIITGKGGMPPKPSDPLVDDLIRVGESQPDRQSQLKQQEASRTKIALAKEQKTFTSDEVIPARGMMINDKGQVVLTAYPTPNADRHPSQGTTNCI